MNDKAVAAATEYIKSWFEFRFNREEIPGMVIAISHKGKMVLNEAHGYADLEKQEKLTKDHIFRIASHSKTFTATALMQLQDQEKLRIDDYVVKYLPWLSKHKDTRWQKVTVRQLMSHGAGVVRDGLTSNYWQLEYPFPNVNELKKEILKSDLVVDNNIKLKYSNYGYSLLGLIIEELSGLSYSDYIKKYICEPLNLTNTGSDVVDSILPLSVTSYTRRDYSKTRLPIDNVQTNAMAPATGFYSTAADICTYFNAQIIGSGKLLNDESKKEMQRVQWHAKNPGQDSHEDYGLGFEIDYLKNRVVFGHGGGFPGQITKTIIDPKDEIVITVLTNCLASPAVLVAKNLFAVFDYFKANTPTKKPKHDFSNLQGRYMNLWGMEDIVVTGDKVSSVFPDTWMPFSYIEELEHVKGTTFKITNTSSFGSEDELVAFNIKNGKVETLNSAGSTSWPVDVWYKKTSKLQNISILNMSKG